ncbi:hypothetical protein TNCT_168381 [Trichonephila clavata]|uniref:Uncharacterized protein n=1 Tax=Trichonephila clavata TaxID=2740835 RepID=A0A8X6IPR9_TRICU|nr:hypothetical protein TNCT_168381 [Trichonephila clavata]
MSDMIPNIIDPKKVLYKKSGAQSCVGKRNNKLHIYLVTKEFSTNVKNFLVFVKREAFDGTTCKSKECCLGVDRSSQTTATITSTERADPSILFKGFLRENAILDK